MNMLLLSHTLIDGHRNSPEDFDAAALPLAFGRGGIMPWDTVECGSGTALLDLLDIGRDAAVAVGLAKRKRSDDDDVAEEDDDLDEDDDDLDDDDDDDLDDDDDDDLDDGFDDDLDDDDEIFYDEDEDE